MLAHLGRPRRAAAPAKLPHPLHTHPPSPFLQTWPRLDFIKMGDLTFRWAPPLLRRPAATRRVGRGATDRRQNRTCGGLPPLSIQLRLQRASFVGTPAGSHVVHKPWATPLVPACTHARRQPDHAKYPSMKVAYAAGRAGGTMTGVMSAANEQVGAGVGARGKWVNAALQGASARRARNAAWSQEPEVLVRPATCHDAPPRGLPALLLLTRPPAPPHPQPLTLRVCLQAVEMFLEEKISYLDIVRVVEECCAAHRAELGGGPHTGGDRALTTRSAQRRSCVFACLLEPASGRAGGSAGAVGGCCAAGGAGP